MAILEENVLQVPKVANEIYKANDRNVVIVYEDIFPGIYKQNKDMFWHGLSCY